MNNIDPAWAWSQFKPTNRQPWNLTQAAHLYRRSGFGVGRGELQRAVAGGVQRCVQQILHDNQESQSFQDEMALMTRSIVSSGNLQSLATAWLYRMLKTTDQLHEKTTLFWHSHFATSADKVQDAFMMQQQNDLLRKYAIGDFSEMVQAISQNPAMLLYLDSANNRKTHPNENFARELMELFCLGEGNYTEQDIRELARCFTGWEVRNRAYRFNKYQHDFGEKAFLGTQGELTGQQAVAHVISTPAAPLFIARKLVQYYVMDEPTAPEELLAPLAKRLRKDKFQIRGTLEMIFRSNLFYSEHAVARKIKSPVEMVIGIMRGLSIKTDLTQVAQQLQEIGHGIYFPPNVKGWDGGRTWINSSTLLGRSNLMHALIHSETTTFGNTSLQSHLQNNRIHSLAHAATYFSDMFCAVPLADNSKSQLIASAQKETNNTEQQFKSLLHQVVSLPQFQLG
ncbi:MAG: DUF1800 domain-containing protein [Planctomycetota bacterium]|nr:DUF1800 domain-containing protein [Planctomycetota bacterium]